ncbi:RNA-directed DNA polymerase from mobile element jockey, partial [Paramuricea clavata]
FTSVSTRIFYDEPNTTSRQQTGYLTSQFVKRRLFTIALSYERYTKKMKLRDNNKGKYKILAAAHPGIVSDVVITGYLEKTWRGSDLKDDDSVMWRSINRDLTSSLAKNVIFKYIQTRAEDKSSYIRYNTNADVHDLICCYRSMCIVVVSSSSNESCIFDISYMMAMNVMPGCLDEYDCFLMDQSGYLFVNLNEHHPLVHVTEKFSWIPKQLVETHRILKPRWCLSLISNLKFAKKLHYIENFQSPPAFNARKYFGLKGLINSIMNTFTKITCPAFDRINHNILIAKLIALGVRRCLIPWICDFLSNRRQAVKINESRSEWAYVNGGVPQGTKLGPILFLVMINDLKMKSLNSSHWKYVDDVTISEVIKETEESRLQTELNELQQWACENDMKLNGLKCKEMVISFLRQSDNYTPLHINDQQLKLVTSFKILAPTTNASLVNAALSDHKTWNSTKVPECEKVCNAAQRIGLKFNLDLNTLIPVLTDVIKIEIKKNLQQTMYNTLGEKLENNIHGINFKQNSITTTIQGSSMAEIYGKLDKINDAIASRTFSIDIPENGGRKTIIPKQLFVLDVNECLTNVNDCHINATCFDTEDYYNCSCKSGFFGNGRNCK